MTDTLRSRLRNKFIWGGALTGALYGLVIRLAFGTPFFERFGGAMTWAFLLGVPFAIGFITIFILERGEPAGPVVWVIWPWLPLAAAALGTVVTLFEGVICVVLMFPVGMACASVGGIVAGVVVRLSSSSRTNDFIAGVVLLFPLMIAPWEGRVLYSKEIHITENSIDIAAPATLVWKNIEKIPAIHSSELPISWSHRIGFPDPVEATLSREGVGGIRRASFTGGVLFIETIDTWEPEKRLGFSIQAQTDRIPPTTLDEHVRVGGPFFDVLHGEYRLEPLNNGVVRLHLSSQQRLSTDFNWYARIWSDAIMSDLQSRILQVIKARCESKSPAPYN